MHKAKNNKKIIPIIFFVAITVFIICNINNITKSYGEDNEPVPVYFDVYAEQGIEAGGHFIDKETEEPVSELTVEEGHGLSNLSLNPSSMVFNIADNELGDNPHYYEFIPDENSVFTKFVVTGLDCKVGEPYWLIDDGCHITAHVDQKTIGTFYAGNFDQIMSGAHITNVGGDGQLSEDGSYASHESRFFSPLETEIKSFTENCNLEYPGHILTPNGTVFAHYITPSGIQQTSNVIISSDNKESHSNFIGFITTYEEEIPLDFTEFNGEIPVGTEFSLSDDGESINASYLLGVSEENGQSYFHAVPNNDYIFSHYTFNEETVEKDKTYIIENNKTYTIKAVYKTNTEPINPESNFSSIQTDNSTQTSDLTIYAIVAICLLSSIILLINRITYK